MKKILLFLVLCGLAYGAWWYWQERGLQTKGAPTVQSGISEEKNEMFFSCDDGKELRVKMRGDQATVALDARGFTLVKSGEGLYKGAALTLVLSRDAVYVEESGVRTYDNCVEGALAHPTIQMYQSAPGGLTFYYPSFYFLHEQTPDVRSSLASIVLVEDTKENRYLVEGKASEVREGPTSISVQVFQNTGSVSALEWAKKDANWSLGTKTSKAVMVGGREGVSFDWDGLYAGKSTVVTIGKRAYVFSVTSLDPGERILIDYEAVLKSAVFSE